MRIIALIFVIFTFGLIISEIYNAPKPISKSIERTMLVRKNYGDMLDEAKEVAYYMEYPTKDSATFTLIIRDSTAIITKYPDSSMTITIRPTMNETTYYFPNEREISDKTDSISTGNGDCGSEPLPTP
jgi:hypothetical protein